MGWEVKALKHCIEIPITDGPHETPEFVDSGMQFISAEAIKNSRIDFERRRGFITNELFFEYSKKCAPRRDDIFMVKSGNTTGTFAIVETDHAFAIWSPLALIRVDPKRFSPKFVYYNFAADFFQENVRISCSYGTQPNIGMSVIERLVISAPPLVDQQSIAKFLDRETAKIDTLIAKQEAMIDLLKEKRQAVISHSVTKGLDPNVPMKNSGVEWLGDVPKHWTVPPLRAIAQVVRGASPRPAGDPQFFNGEHTPWVTVGEITKDESMYLVDTSSFLTESGAANSRLFRAGTLLLSNSGATLGVPKILAIDGCANDGVVGFERLNESADIQFVYYYLASLTQNLRERIKQGAGQPNLNTDLVKEICIGLPPLQEQRQIVVQLQRAMQRIDVLIDKAQQAIALQKEHRTALISAAVTGKIDVRSEVAHPVQDKEAA
nr:restriction endonuclease subunit S [Massilia brevitalea]